jgi:hypothetical protein
MTSPGSARPLCAILIALLATPASFAQSPPAPVPPIPARTPASPLTITILEGNNSVNSISLLRSVAPVVEIRDSNDFPVEGASVTFTLPVQGPGGAFAQGGKSFSTRSDARGQAMAPFIVPAGVGKFQISVTAAAGDRKGEVVIAQTNADGSYTGPVIPPPAWYKKKSVWAIAGGAAVAIIVIVAVTGGSKSTATATPTTIVITPGTPVFH